VNNKHIKTSKDEGAKTMDMIPWANGQAHKSQTLLYGLA